jgi:hypothetical protein
MSGTLFGCPGTDSLLVLAGWERRLAVAPARRLGVAPLRVGWCVWLIFSDWWVRWRLVERSP